MASCDLCGKEGPLFRVRTEGTEFDVCKNCSRFGTIVAKPKAQTVASPRVTVRLPHQEVMEIIIEDYGQRVKQRREQLGLTHEELGRKLAERASLLQKIESQHQEPSLALARKIERILGISLILKHEEVHAAPLHQPGKSFTIGDFLKK